MEQKIHRLFKEALRKTYTVDGTQINLFDLGWSIAYSNKKRAMGTCNYSKKTLYLSKFLIQNGNRGIEEWEDTILHEVAHALCKIRYNERGHGSTWKRVAKSIGCNGERCGNARLDISHYKYILECENCGRKAKRHRLPKGELACGRCCKEYNNGKYTERFSFKVLTQH